MKKRMGVIFISCMSLSSLYAKAPRDICVNAEQTNVNITIPGFSGGEGTFTNPYVICSKEQLMRLANEPDLLGKHFRLSSDLDFQGVPFHAIGSRLHPFQGTFDGDGYLLSNITITLENSKKNVGIFASVKDSKIENLIINGVTIADYGISNVGGLIGKSVDSHINNIQIYHLNMKSPSRAGGMIGYARNCTLFNVAVEGEMYQWSDSESNGGLIGQADDSIISSAHTQVNLIQSAITAQDVVNLGGIIGVLNNSQVRNVYATGSIDYTASFEANPILYPSHIGGLIGQMNNSSLEYAYYAGGMNILTDTSSGVISDMSNSNSNHVFWDIELSGVSSSAAGEGKPTSILKQAAFWQAQEFDHQTWLIMDGEYPTLSGLR